MTSSAPRPPIRVALEVCPVEVGIAVLGGTWKLTVVKHLLEAGTMRSGDLSRTVPQASQRTLTRQLRELEQDGVVHRRVYPEVPPRVEYSLTQLGSSLAEVVAAMNAWGRVYEAHLDTDAAGQQV